MHARTPDRAADGLPSVPPQRPRAINWRAHAATVVLSIGIMYYHIYYYSLNATKVSTQTNNGTNVIQAPRHQVRLPLPLPLPCAYY